MTPEVKRGLAQTALRDGFGFGQLALGIDATHIILLDFDRDRVELHAARDLDRIGQIKFAFAITVADPLQDGERVRAGERHDATIAQTERPFARAGISILANGDERVVLDD